MNLRRFSERGVVLCSVAARGLFAFCHFLRIFLAIVLMQLSYTSGRVSELLDYPASSGVVFASAERLSDCVNLDQEADVKKASV